MSKLKLEFGPLKVALKDLVARITAINEKLESLHSEREEIAYASLPRSEIISRLSDYVDVQAKHFARQRPMHPHRQQHVR